MSTGTKNSRKNKDSSRIWRRRFCEECGRHFTTYETPYIDNLFNVTTSGGKSEKFSSDKLFASILEAFTATEDDHSTARTNAKYIFEQAVTNIARLHPPQDHTAETPQATSIQSKDISTLVQQLLVDYSDKAYYRYLSSL